MEMELLSESQSMHVDTFAAQKNVTKAGEVENESWDLTRILPLATWGRKVVFS